jgi:ACR3 family arsenite transporter
MKNGSALRLAEHLRKYLLVYVVVVILLALPIGYYGGPFFRANKVLMKNVILSLAIITLFPSMIQLRADKFASELREKVRDTIVGLIFIFGVAPGLAMFLARFISDQQISIGFVAANSVPASSASIAYVLLAEANIEFATLLAVLSIIGALVAVPAYVGLYASSVSVSLPIDVLGESVALALLTPFILGQLVRYYAVKVRAKSVLRNPEIELPCKAIEVADPKGKLLGVEDVMQRLEDALECIEGRISKKLKPYLSLTTMLSMLFLIGVLIANKAYLLIAKPQVALLTIGSQLIIYAVLITAIILTSKVIRQNYEDHMGLAFIAMTKNESVAAAVSVMAIGSAAAIPAALIPAVQPVVAISYLAVAPFLRRFLGKGS